MKKSLIFFAALAALFSCAKENPVVETPAEETFSVELFASAPAGDAETKTTLVDGVDGEGKPIKFVHWSKDDAIKVLFFPVTINHNAAFSGSNGVFTSHFDAEASASAYFRCDSWSWGSKVVEQGISASLQPAGIAVYPATATATSSKPQNKYVNADTEISFSLPSAQNAVKDNIESNLNFSYADVELSKFQNTISNGAQTDLKFNNACAMIALTMPSTLDKKVTAISITSNSGVSLTGKGTVKLDSYNNVVASPFAVDITDGHGVVLNNTNGFEVGATYYAVVWPGVHNSGLTIEFTAEDGSVATKTTPSVTLKASMVKPYTFNKGLVFESAAPKEYDYIYADGSMGNDPVPSGKTVVGVIFFNGNPRENDPALPEYCTHGLAIGLTNYNYAFHTSNLPTTSAVGSYGIGTTNQYGQVQSNGNVYGYTSMTNWLMNFSDLNLYKQLPTPISNTSGWYVQTNCEWNMIASCFEQINEKLAKCGAVDKLETNKDYTTALGYGYSNNRYNYVYYAKISASYTLSMTRQNWGTSAVTVRPIFAF